MKRTLTISLILVVVATFLVFWFYNKSGIYITDQVIVQPDGDNALRSEIKLITNTEATVKIKYSIGDEIFYSENSELGRNHLIHLVGLRPNSTYKCQAIMSNGATSELSEVFEVKTLNIPETLPEIKWEEKGNSSFSGYVLTQRRFADGNVYMFDSKGEIVWYQSVPKQPKLANWTGDRTVLILYGDELLKNSAGDHVVEYDIYGRKLLDLDLTKLDVPLEAHHDVLVTTENNLLMLVYEPKEFDLSSVGGVSNQMVLGDAIVLLDKNGNQLWKWSVFDYADPAQDSEILNSKSDKFQFLKRTFDDWSHGNSLSIDTDGNYLISLRNWNQIWKINSTSGDVMWKLGEGGDIEITKKDQFSGQHSIHVNRRGEYMLFDNGRELRQTRILSFDIDELSKTATLKINIDLPRQLFSDRMGSAYLLENDNILVCAPKTGSIIILNPKGEILSHARVGLPDPYRAEYVPSLYQAHRDE